MDRKIIKLRETIIVNRILKISAMFAISTFYVSHVSAITVSDKANKLAQENIIIDSHIDVPYRLEEKWVDVTKATKEGDFDYPRAKQGGLNAPFMSIYIPASRGDGKSRCLCPSFSPKSKSPYMNK